MSSEQIVDVGLFDTVNKKPATIDEYIINNGGDALVFLYNDVQLATLKSLLYESINSGAALSFETTITSSGFEHTNTFAEPFIKIILDNVYYIRYAESELIFEEHQFWRLTHAGQFKNSEKNLCNIYSISKYNPIVLNLDLTEDTSVNQGSIVDHESMPSESGPVESPPAESAPVESPPNSEFNTNQTRKLSIISKLLRKTFKIKSK